MIKGKNTTFSSLVFWRGTLGLTCFEMFKGNFFFRMKSEQKFNLHDCGSW